MSDETKRLMERMLATFASGDSTEARAIVADDYVDHQDGLVGADGFAGLVEAVSRRYPDLRVLVQDLMAEGNKAVARVRWEGTGANGHKVSASSIDIVRFENGRAAEHWGISKGWP